MHPRSLIGTFVIRLLESIISKLATREISNFKTVSVAEQAGLGMNVDRPRGYKTFTMLNSAEHQIYPAHKC